MRRRLTALLVLALIAAACSGGSPAEREAVEAQSAGESAAALDNGEQVTPDQPGPVVGPVEQAGDRPSTTTTIFAEEMMLDELNVAYFSEWPAASHAARAAVSYGDALDMAVNWIPFTPGDDLARAMEAGEIDIAHSHDATSFARLVSGGATLLMVGIAAGYVDSGDMTGAEQGAAGVSGFGVVSTTRGFAAEYPDAVSGFLRVTDDAYRVYNADRELLIDPIASMAGLDRDATIALLDGLVLPERDAQLSEAWLGGAVQQVMKDRMDLLADQGVIDSTLGSYDAYVDTSFLETVNRG